MLWFPLDRFAAVRERRLDLSPALPIAPPHHLTGLLQTLHQWSDRPWLKIEGPATPPIV